jgi:hypothetical protein
VALPPHCRNAAFRPWENQQGVFGHGHILARIPHALLYSATNEEYERRVRRACLLTDHFKSIGRASEIAVRQFPDLFEEDASTSAERFEPQAPGTSSQFGVTTCSNHIKRLLRNGGRNAGGLSVGKDLGAIRSLANEGGVRMIRKRRFVEKLWK